MLRYVALPVFDFTGLAPRATSAEATPAGVY